MRYLIAIGVLTAGLGANAQAAPVSVPPLDTGIVAVSGGCGPGGFRGRDGYCHPRRPPPPPYYRRCPPGTHPTPYGCRPNY